jgi:hypothetical protein
MDIRRKHTSDVEKIKKLQERTINE